MTATVPTGRPILIGEVLFDCFPDGSRVLGGAPFNVAWHLQAFGLDPLLISRVGADQAGDEVLAAMESWGMDRTGVQRDEELPTGWLAYDPAEANRLLDGAGLTRDGGYDQHGEIDQDKQPTSA